MEGKFFFAWRSAERRCFILEVIVLGFEEVMIHHKKVFGVGLTTTFV
jgi:hypothetical protein